MENRRNFLVKSLGALAALSLGKNAGAMAIEQCETTPMQSPGPYIPQDFDFPQAPVSGHPYVTVEDKDADFTRVTGKLGSAKGQVLYLQGQVVDENCRPVPAATVYLWQADDHGYYNHSDDGNVPAPQAEQLDPNFQYRGIVNTDENGRFQLKTIKPKYYALDAKRTDLLRTAHIHIVVLKTGFQDFVTQAYFEGDALEDIETIRRLNITDIFLGAYEGRRSLGHINPTYLPLVVEYREQAGFDAPVGQLRLAIHRSRIGI